MTINVILPLKIIEWSPVSIKLDSILAVHCVLGIFTEMFSTYVRRK